MFGIHKDDDKVYDEVYYDDSMHAMACTLYGQIMYACTQTVCTPNCSYVPSRDRNLKCSIHRMLRAAQVAQATKLNGS